MRRVTLLLAGMLMAGCCLTPGAMLSASADTTIQEDTVYFRDEGDFLTEDERDWLIWRLTETSEEIDMNIGIWIGNQPMDDPTTVAQCDDAYDAAFGIDTDGVLYYLDLSSDIPRYYYISTSGMAHFYYTNSDEYDRIHAIHVALDDYTERYNELPYEAIDAFCDELVYYYDLGIPDEDYYVYFEDKDAYLVYEDGQVQWRDSLPLYRRSDMNLGVTVLICIGIGLAVGLFAMWTIRSRYRFRTPEHASVYLQNQQVEFTHRQDTFLRQYRTRTKIERDSSSGGGGGGSGHTSSSGGSHGGGGHHR